MEKTMEAEFSNDDFYCLPYNLGVSGNTIEDILPRLKSEINARFDQNNPNERVELVFSIGVNDSVYLVQENKPRFSDDQFHNNLLELISISKDIADRISFIGLLPFLPLFDTWNNDQDWQRKLIDGVHPNSDGHALLANQIFDFLLTDDFVKYHSVNN
jgi:lysophospholipase L1-like esterase